MSPAQERCGLRAGATGFAQGDEPGDSTSTSRTFDTVMRAAGGGTIVNISSVAGHIPLAFGAAYSASKFAMNAIGKGARLELRADNIHVLTVCPGYVATDFSKNLIAARRGSTRPKAVRGISAERVARAVYDGYRRQKREVIVPWTMHPVVKLYQLFPSLVEWGMLRMMPPNSEKRG